MPELKSHPQAYISSSPILRVHYMALDMRSAPFDKKAARQAANHAIDRQAMLQKMMAGLGKEVATVVQPASFGFDPSVQPYAFDPKRARALLAQAGYPNGVDITLHSAAVDWRPHFEALGQMLTEVGLRTTVKMWDPGPAWNKFFQTEGNATHGAYGSWGNYSVFDADAVLHPLYHTEPGGWIGKHYARVEGLDKLIDEARSIVDQNRRKQIYARIQALIREEAPSVFLYTQNDTLGISRKVAYEARPDEWLWLYAARPQN
jgi:peptide/nickel transport system substrate-binding protein